MESRVQARSVVRAGDLDGLRRIYSDVGGLMTESDEEIMRVAAGWEVNVRSPWRRFLPKNVFEGFRGKASSKLFVTDRRIVLLRDIDPWRELKGELTPLGIPTAAAKEVRLKQLKSRGVRQYCEIRPRDLRVVKKRSFDRPRSWVDLRLLGVDGQQYAITLWKTDGSDQETRVLIESQFGH
jgi:hypothetical protein